MSNLGWECPRCHSVYGPHVFSCQYCGPTTDTGTGTAQSLGRVVRPCTCNSSAAQPGMLCPVHPDRPVTVSDGSAAGGGKKVLHD
jgi:hypothetical protein